MLEIGTATQPFEFVKFYCSKGASQLAASAPVGGIRLSRTMRKRAKLAGDRLSRQMEALCDPVCRRAFELIAEFGPLSTTELADRIDADVGTLLAHTNALEAAGLIVFLRPLEENGRLRVYKAVENGCGPLIEWIDRTKGFRFSEA